MGRFWRGVLTGSIVGLVVGLYMYLNMNQRTERSLRMGTEQVGRVARRTVEGVKEGAIWVGQMGKSLMDGGMRRR